jgi:hypothetical protein
VLDVVRERNALAYSVGQYEHSVRRANTVQVLDKQTLSGKLHDVGRLDAPRPWLVLYRDEGLPRPQKLVRTADQTQALGAQR